MKLKNTPEQLRALAEQLRKCGTLYESKSSYAKRDAQRNLDGRTHYVEDDTLRFHHSRVLSRRILAEGLFYEICCSDGLDWENRRRGFRVTTFDVFGTALGRPDLEHSSNSSRQAWKASEAMDLDAVKHYAEALQSKVHYAQEEVAKLEKSLEAVKGIGA